MVKRHSIWISFKKVDVQKTLVFGSTGFLGKTFFLKPSLKFIPITRRLFDFQQSTPTALTQFLEETNATSAIILTAISSPDDCLRDPTTSHAVNVEGTIRLLQVLKELEIKPIFFSSDHVFDGIKGHYQEDDAYSPITLYGRQKVLTETFIRENFSDFLILRSSKQVAMRIDPKNTLSEMAIQLKSGRPIRCATDNWIAPSFVEDIFRLTQLASENGLSGVFHIAPAQQLSRLELGLLIASTVGASPKLVESCSILDFKFLEVRPPRCTLDGSRLTNQLNFKMTELARGLEILNASLT